MATSDGGTLGILIPPSINMIFYAVPTDTSVADLYAAGFIPGFMLAALFSLVVVGWVYAGIATPTAAARQLAGGPGVTSTRAGATR